MGARGTRWKCVRDRRVSVDAPRAAPFLSGLILAAGRSERMGQPKQLLPLRGKPLIQYAIDAALEARLDEVVLVLGFHADEVRAAIAVPKGANLRIVMNGEYEEGQGSSLRAGLRAVDARATGVAILLADQPGVDARLVRRIANAFLASEAAVLRPVFRADDGERVPGHPVFLDHRIFDSVIEEVRGDLGLRGLLPHHPEWLEELILDEPSPPDIDTPEAFAALDRA